MGDYPESPDPKDNEISRLKGALARCRRQRLGLTMGDASREVGTTVVAVSNMERGITNAEALLDWLDTKRASLNSVLDGEEP